MQWTFHRNGLKLIVETWRGDADDEYVLRIQSSSGYEWVETLSGDVRFRQRLLALEMQLAQENWAGSSSMADAAADPTLEAVLGERRTGTRDRRRATRMDRRGSRSTAQLKAEPATADRGRDPSGRNGSEDSSRARPPS